MTRPSWDEYGLALAKTASIRGDCTRRRVGACILGSDHRVLGLGYNGYEAGGKSCLKGECPRGMHYNVGAIEQPLGDYADTCACGDYWPCPDYATPGSGYAESGCEAIHAERNAIGDRSVSLQNATMYITEAPCEDCRAMIQGTYIVKVIWPGGTWNVHTD